MKPFARLATELAIKPVSGFSPWRDGTDLIELLVNFQAGYFTDFPFEDEIISALERGIISMLDNGVAYDDLEQISDAIHSREEFLSPDISTAARDAIQREFDVLRRKPIQSRRWKSKKPCSRGWLLGQESQTWRCQRP
jgi:hypothetical protein